MLLHRDLCDLLNVHPGATADLAQLELGYLASQMHLSLHLSSPQVERASLLRDVD